MMLETTVNGWDERMTTHARWCTKQLLMDERDEGINNRWRINSCSCMKRMKDYTYQMVYKTTCWWTKQMMESIPDDARSKCWWRRPTKQLLKLKTDEGINIRWCTKQLLIGNTNEGLPIPDDVQNSCWWIWEMKESMPDDAQCNCWWMRPM